MNKDHIVLVVVAVATAAAAGGLVYKRLNIRGLPTMTDRDFLRSYWKLNEASIDAQRLAEDRRAAGLPLGNTPETLGAVVCAFAEVDAAVRSRR